MTLRRYTPLSPSAGTTWPPAVKAEIVSRDRGCVGPRIGMEGACVLGIEVDHVRASHAVGMKSSSVIENGVSLCARHHRQKTENGKRWRPLLLSYIASRDQRYRPVAHG